MSLDKSELEKRSYQQHNDLNGLLDINPNNSQDSELTTCINNIRTKIIESPLTEVKLPKDLPINLIGPSVLTDLDYKIKNNIKIPYLWIRDIITLYFTIECKLVEPHHIFTLALNLGDFGLAKKYQKLYNIKSFDQIDIYPNKIDIMSKYLFLIQELSFSKISALYHASENGHLQVVKYLVNENKNILDDNLDVIDNAAGYGHLNVVTFLVKNGIKICNNSDTSLCNAAENGYGEVVATLIHENVSEGMEEMLQLSALNGHLDMVKYLVMVGADIRTDNYYVLNCAAENGHLDIVKYLVSIGANIHIEDDRVLCIAAKNGHLNIVEYLLSLGANIHTDNDAALCSAAESGYLDIVEFLLSKGAKIHTVDDYPLRFSAKNGHLEVVKLLLSKGAYIHAQRDATLRNAVNKLRINIVKYLTENFLFQPEILKSIKTINPEIQKMLDSQIICTI